MLARNLVLALAGIIGSFIVLILLLPTPSDTLDAATSLVIDDVRYFDGERLVGPTRLVLAGGQIAAIGAHARAPAGAPHLDGEGLTALPGLIDAHVHTYGTSRRDALRFGVTTVLDMFTDPMNLLGARESRDAYGAADAAALFSAGMLATVEGGHGTQFPVPVETLQDSSEATAWVAARVAEGSDYIKLVYMPDWPGRASLDFATASAIIDAAHAAGLKAVAHIATQKDARALLGAGIDGFVHIFADSIVDDEFLREARERGVFIVPTLAIIATASGQSTGPGLLEHPELGERVDALARVNLRQTFGNVRSPIFDLDKALTNVRRLHEAGVPILAGSDAPNPGTAHGISVHGELRLLVRAGLSPAAAIAAATHVAAEQFGLEGRGRIAEGARADLLLISGDPLVSIEATADIRTVLRNGFFSGDALPPAGESMRLAGALSDFDTGLNGPSGLSWTATSDALMGGTSKAQINLLDGDEAGRGGTLAVQATVTRAFPYPWAGAFLAFGGPDQSADLTAISAVRFAVRGTPARYRLMMFEQGVRTPPTVVFTVGEQWREVQIPLADFAGFTATRFIGMAFVSPDAAGEYTFALDDVQLVP
ncbi:MAG: CIA30 family protein [Pseudomonadota bacterium]